MNPQEILDAYALTTKRGKLHGGWEPCFNAYFDFYVSNRYVAPALIQLDDVSLHLYLRKNFNPDNPKWEQPGIKQIMRRLGIGYNRFTAMTDRLKGAQLLTIISGQHAGEQREHLPNRYLLSDPIQTLPEFIAVAKAGLFTNSKLRDEWLDYDPYDQNGDRVSPEQGYPPISEIARDQHTYKTEHIGGGVWETVLEALRPSMPYDTFSRMLAGSELLCIDNGKAVVGVPCTEAIPWLQNRMSRNVKMVLGIEAHEKIEAVEFVALENDGGKVSLSILTPVPD